MCSMYFYHFFEQGKPPSALFSSTSGIYKSFTYRHHTFEPSISSKKKIAR